MGGLAVLLLVLGACGGGGGSKSNAPATGSSHAPATNNASTDKIQGELTTAGPDRHAVTLTAGTAVKLFARPVAGSKPICPQNGSDSGDCVDLNGDTGITVAIAGDSGVQSYVSAARAQNEEIGGDTSSRGDDFFSDYDSPPADLAGTIIMFTGYVSPATETVSADPNWFDAFGLGWGHAQLNGSWFMFIAPVDGTYTFLFSGTTGPYSGRFSTNPPPDVSGGASNFNNDPGSSPYTSSQWKQLVHDQLSYLFADSFFPSADSFFTDYSSDPDAAGQPKQTYGPTTELRNKIEQQLGES